MKRTTSILLLIVFLLGMNCMPAYAADYSGMDDNWYYGYNDSQAYRKVSLNGYRGTSKDLGIGDVPAKVLGGEAGPFGQDLRNTSPDADGYHPISVLSAFRYNSADSENGKYTTTLLDSIVLPYGFTSIATHGFSGQKNLKTLYLPDSIETIGNTAFHGCSGLETLVLSKNMKEIGTSFGGFTGVVYFRSMTAPVIASSAFTGSHVTVYYPEGATGYDTEAFQSAFKYEYTLTPYTALPSEAAAYYAAQEDESTPTAAPESTIEVKPTPGQPEVIKPGKKFIAAADSFVANAAGMKDKNEGTSSQLYCRTMRNYTDQTRLTYLKFDLTDMPIMDFPYAKLYIKTKPTKINNVVQDNTNIIVSAVQDTAWKENKITWNNQPSLRGTVKVGSFYYDQTAGDQWCELDLTDYIKENRNQVITLVLATEKVSTQNRCYFYSKEAGETFAPYIQFGATALDVIKDTSYSFQNADGKISYLPVKGGTVNFRTTLMSNSTAYKSAVFVGAVYKESENRLLGICMDKRELPMEQEVTFQCKLDNLPEYSEDIVIKSMIWADLDTIMPLFLPSRYIDPTIPVYQEGKITMVSPGLREDITEDNVTLKLYAPGFKDLTFECAHQPDETSDKEYSKVFASQVIPDTKGYVEAVFPASQFPYGPIAIKITAKDTLPGDITPADTLEYYVQLYNTVGVQWNMGAKGTPPAAVGMELVYTDDFKKALSISRTGSGTTYSSHTPFGGDYGKATFEDFEGAYNPFAQRDSYMKISVTAPENYAENNRAGNEYAGGLISSAHPGQTGRAWEYGYFECRMLCPPGMGTWPAFWLLSLDRIDDKSKLTFTSEVDIVEGYGYELDQPRQCYHRWGFNAFENQTENRSTKFNMTQNGMLNTAQTFHTYAAKITEEYVYFYIDDVEVWRQVTDEESKKPLLFMINLAMGEGGGGIVDLSDYGMGADLYVDYVRVYTPYQ